MGLKRSLLVEGASIPFEGELAGAYRHDSPLLCPTLERLYSLGFDLPETIMTTPARQAV
ncbi:hypothetical protein [Kocuria sp. NPDC057446]|uniref:hypothetical protein n=1 Tax=Kocuria sp. NPDC057446 TaxID=3346137 RepID=UPI0036A3BFEA